MYSVDFWYPLLVKIDKVKNDFKLNKKQVRELDIIEADVFSMIHVGSEDTDEYTVLTFKLKEFKKQFTA